MQYNKDMKSTTVILIGCLLVAGFLFGLFWFILNAYFEMAIKLSGGM